jgi:chromosome segregation ATPase
MTTLAAFRTPPRILIPKLVRSRNAWKDKATTRKTQRKALEIRVRDLEASRDLHRQRADQLEERVTQLETQLDELERPVPAPTDSPQNSTGPAVDITVSPPSTSP